MRLLPSLARNVVTNGFQATRGNEALEQTEYLKLVHRYISQARELEKLAGAGKTIKIDTCDSPNAGDLLRILGFRMRGGCGSEVVLETVNATRAFSDHRFRLPHSGTGAGFCAPTVRSPTTFQLLACIPILFGADYWLTAKEKETGDFIDVLLSDPSLCRLYLGVSKLDRETAEEFRKNVTMPRLKAYAHELDIFGGMFEIRGGKAMVPEERRPRAALGRVSRRSLPDRGAAFFEKLLARDDGWLCSYYDALARINGPVREYLTEPARMERFYQAIRGKVTSPGPARPVFRSNADMMLLTTRLWMDPNGLNARSSAIWYGKICLRATRKASTTPSSRAPPAPGKIRTMFWKRCSDFLARRWKMSLLKFSWRSAIWIATVPNRWRRRR